MSVGPNGGADEDPRVDALLRVNEELATEIRALQGGRVPYARSAAAPSARRLGRLLVERDELVAIRAGLTAERDALLEERDWLREEIEKRDAIIEAEGERAALAEGDRAELVAKIEEYGRLADALKLEVERLRSGFGGAIRRGVARVRSMRRG